METKAVRKLSRNEWIQGAFETLVDGGIESLRVEPLAKRLGVTKGSFYHHFDTRRDLHLAMLSAWELAGTAQIISDVEDEATNPADRLRSLIHRTTRSDPHVDGIETGIRAWASTDEDVRSSVTRVDERRIDYVVELLKQTGVENPLAIRRARLLYRLLIGEYMWRTSGGPASSDVELDELADLLLPLSS